MRADLHIHSVHSANDGESAVADIIERAIEAGLGCIAITDHNSVGAWAEASSETRILVIPGVEVSSSEGHILAYGVTEDIPRGMSAEDTIAAIRAAGGYAFAAHPYRWWSGLGEEATVGNDFDGIEARNGRSARSGNARAERLAMASGKPVSAGSDAHHVSHIGEGYVDLPDSETWQEALGHLMAGRGAPHSVNRKPRDSIEYGVKSIVRWIFRGFKRT